MTQGESLDQIKNLCELGRMMFVQNLEGPLNIHQCPAQQKGSTFAISLWSQFEILFLPFALLKQNIIMIVILMMIVR